MMFLLLFAMLAGVTAILWFHGLWSNAITLVSLLISGFVAVNFFEPLAGMLDESLPKMTYLFDFLMLWLLFALTFGILRALTDTLSKDWVLFPKYVELAGRSILAFWCAWVVVCFTAFTLLTAPLGAAAPLGAWESPADVTFLGIGPERLFLGLVHSKSRGVFARGHFSDQPGHPNDTESDVEAFDPQGDFIYKYHSRRANLAAQEGLQVDR